MTRTGQFREYDTVRALERRFISAKMTDKAVAGLIAYLKENSVVTRVIQAAGGLIWHDFAQGKKIAVVHRPHYDDWTLPKGKLGNEEYQDAAVREVKEETGCKVQLGSFAGSISYTVKRDSQEIPKIVLFWNMTLDGECNFRPNEETDRLLWLPADDAIHKLSYQDQRRLVSDNYGVSATTSHVWTRIGNRLGLSKSTSYMRLEDSLNRYRVELDHLVKQCKSKNGSTPPWSEAVRDLLDKVEQALKSDNAQGGWEYFHAAQRMALFGLESNQIALKAKALSILNEAHEKLSSWRKKTVEDILGGHKSTFKAAEVHYANEILDDHLDNVYRKLSFINRQLKMLAVAGSLVLVALVFFAPSLLGVEQQFVLSLLLFGALGASVSGLISTAKSGFGLRIPDLLANWYISLARLVVGAGAALAVYTFLISGLLSVGPQLSTGLALAVSFASGFSERLVVRAVESVAK